MAGDWMKVELELPDKPEVHYISGALNLDPDAVVGKLIRVWQWFNKHTEDGNAFGVTYSLVDRITGVTGFGESMQFVGWLEQDGHSLIMPRFERHTSESAKKRALTNRRVAEHRAKKCNADSVTKSVTREEKRRDKEKEKKEAWEKPASVDATAWQEFENHRAEIKKPLTNQSRTKNANILADYPAEVQQQIVDATIANRWTGLFPPKGQTTEKGSMDTRRPSTRTL